jgi:hypothetical protein
MKNTHTILALLTEAQINVIENKPGQAIALLESVIHHIRVNVLEEIEDNNLNAP